MSKRPIAIEIDVQSESGIPKSFNWKNRWYSVQQVLMFWVEVGPWWKSTTEFADSDGSEITWRIWRIEAKSESGAVIADIAFRDSLTSSSAYPWRLIRVFD